MWTRRELKEKGLIFYKRYFITSVFVCLFISILGSIFNYNENSGGNSIQEYYDDANGSYQSVYYYKPFGLSENLFQLNVLKNNDFVQNHVQDNKVAKVLFGRGFEFYISKSTVLILILIGIIGKIFIYNPISIGAKRYFINGNRDLETEEKFNIVFSPYIDGTWASLGIKLLIRDIFIMLWTLLLIIPGIYKSFQYYYVPYILADDPDLKITEAIDISKEMTTDDKFNIFVLQLSFIGWEILSILTFGIGFIFLNPYMESTNANLYITVNEEYYDKNI